MAFEGFVVLGDALNAPFTTDVGDHIAVAPTGTPTYSIYAADMSEAIVSAQNCTQLAALTGVYYVPATISSNNYAAGVTYTVVIVYTISAVNYTKTMRFSAT
jgi:hypothetical protein